MNTPIPKTITFVALSVHFQRPGEAERELLGIVNIMKQFPLLRVTIQGNLANAFVAPNLFGFGTAARADQNQRFAAPAQIRWPTEVETYLSNGQVMDSRARTIRQYLINKGIAPDRVATARGQYLKNRTVTIIFSN